MRLPPIPSAGSTSHPSEAPPCGRGADACLPTIVSGMAQMIVAFLGTAGWMGGVLVLGIMAVLPLLENFSDADGG